MPTRPDGSFEFAEFSGLCGPNELASTVIDFRQHRRATEGADCSYTIASLSDDNTARLLKLIYLASQCSEEGRLPKFMCFVPPESGTSPERLVDFDPPIEFMDVSAIRKLAPVVSTKDAALRIVEREGRMTCDGIVKQSGINEAYALGSPQNLEIIDHGLWIRVEGPGELLVREVDGRFSLHRGQIRYLFSYQTMAPVNDWLSELSQQIASEIIAVDNKDNWKTGAHNASRRLLGSVWGSVIERTIAARHGGTFLVVKNISTDNLTLHQNCRRLDISQAIRELVEASFAALHIDRNNWKSFQRALVKWSDAKECLWQSAETVAALANGDGCVVLNRELYLIGFGGEIIAADNAGELNGQVYKGEFTSKSTFERTQKIDAKQFGTRHRSAIRFCQQNSDAIAFVISQDGDFRIVCHDGTGDAVVFDALSAIHNL